MKTTTHGNGNGLDDLYILPDNEQERQRIADYLKSIGIRYEWSFSDVEGQDWHGKHFFELPFGEGLLGVIQQSVSGPRYRCNFTGRRVGAIGITYPVEIEVQADNEDQARDACYAADWEHIGGFSAVRL